MTSPAEHALLDVVGGDLRVPIVPDGEQRYVNLDYAASSPALRSVADHIAELLPYYSSVHRGAGYTSSVATQLYEAARHDVGSFVGARDDDVVIFTRNTTDSLNLLSRVVPHDGRIVSLDIEHHANLLPWQRTGRALIVRSADTFDATFAALEQALSQQPVALLAVTGASNVTGEILPLATLADLAHRYGARLVVDAAQLAPHRPIDIAAADIDYLAFSGHKIYAPFGTGVLVGRRDWLDAGPPYLAGGGAVRQVDVGRTTWVDSPARHEAGTPNVVGAAALAAACRALAGLPAGALVAHEEALRSRLLGGLRAISDVTVVDIWPSSRDRIAVATFVVEGVPASLVAGYLSAEHAIGVRDGRFCAHPLLAKLGVVSASRASVGVGSSLDDVDRLLTALASLTSSGPHYEVADGQHQPTPDPRPRPSWLPATAASSTHVVGHLYRHCAE